MSWTLIIRQEITCNDGFKISIQASRYHNCAPKDDKGPYKACELGFPSQQDDLLKEYQDGNVYPYVPSNVIKALIEKHRGIRKGELPDLA